MKIILLITLMALSLCGCSNGLKYDSIEDEKYLTKQNITNESFELK